MYQDNKNTKLTCWICVTVKAPAWYHLHCCDVFINIECICHTHATLLLPRLKLIYPMSERPGQFVESTCLYHPQSFSKQATSLGIIFMYWNQSIFFLFKLISWFLYNGNIDLKFVNMLLWPCSRQFHAQNSTSGTSIVSYQSEY